MPNAVELVKKAAVEAVDAGKPVALLYGQVLSEKPLKIQVDQKSIYTEKMLILTRNVTDYEVDIEVSTETKETGGGGGDAAYESHKHALSGTKKIKVRNALRKDDQVVLARVQGGKKFVVLDRVKAAPKLEGEWL